MRLQAVLMNDTSGSRHFGCERVVRVIGEQLRARGIELVARSGVRQDWQRDRRFVEALSGCHVIVINGEGTLHHGSRHGRALLEVAEHAARQGAAIALVNALYQENPPAWGRWLQKMDLVVARDSWSAAELTQAAGRPVQAFGDLSLSAGADEPGFTTEKRDLVVMGDSVYREVTRKLARAGSGSTNMRLMPVTAAVMARQPHFGPIRRCIESVRLSTGAVMTRWRHPGFTLCRDEQHYLRELGRTKLHVTGRFHGVCLSMVAGAPFLAVRSNSWKVEALLDDCGLGESRLVDVADLPAALARPDDFAFTPAEQQAIRSTLERCQAGAAAMFDEIRGLAERVARHRG